MKRTKPPVLTSPWKIGFFVSLMLVAVAIGVAYFFTRTLGTPWSWPHLGEWRAIFENVIHGQGVLVDSWPLLVLVGFSSLISYLVITQAVRKYKRYLDSGHDYKRLLSTIREIEDIEDSNGIAALHNHPELKAFLSKIRDDVEERTLMLDEREKALETRVMATEKKKAEELSSDLNEQCGRLIEAIVRHSGRLGPVDITLPELKRVEGAVRNALQSSGSTGGLGGGADAPPIALEQLRSGVDRAWRELQTMSEGARQLESEVAHMARGGVDADESVDAGAAQEDLEVFLASCAELDKLSTQLAVLGEESRSVAINTALQASSGQAEESGLVQLAEDVKELAANYGKLSKTISKHVAYVKRSASTVGSRVGGAKGAGADIGSVSSKVSLLAERIMLVTEKFKDVWASIEEAGRADMVGDVRAFGDEDSRMMSDERDDTFGGLGSHSEFESMDNSGSIFSSDEEPEPLPGYETGGRAFAPLTEDDETGGRAFAPLTEDDEPADDGMFAELSDQHPAPAEDDEPAPKAAAEPPRPAPPKKAPAPTPAKQAEPEPPAEPQPSHVASVDTSGLELDDGFGGTAPARPTQPEKTPKTSKAAQPRKAPKAADTAADIIDLYELGAVDYDPVAHG